MAEEMLIQRFVNVELKKMIAVLRTFDDGHNFIEPVVLKWPSLAREYRSKIKEPMDIHTMIQRVESNKYKFFQLDGFVRDFTLIGANCMEFNQPKPGEINTYYDVGESFMKRGVAYSRPLVKALADRIVRCRKGEFPASEIGTGMDYTEKELSVEEAAAAAAAEAAEDEEKENKPDAAGGAEAAAANQAAAADGGGEGGDGGAAAGGDGAAGAGADAGDGGGGEGGDGAEAEKPPKAE